MVVLSLGIVLAGVTLTGGNIKAIKGATDVSYPIYLDNDEDIVGFQLEVNYSTNYLTLKDVVATSRLPNATIVYNDQSPLVNISVVVNNESEKINSGNGSLLNLIFDVDSDALSDSYTIDIFDLITADISALTLNSSEVDGVFEIVEPYDLTFLPPISNFDNFTIQEGATLPFKFNVTDDNDFVEDYSVLVRIYNLTLGIDHIYNASGSGNDYISIDSVEAHYKIDIKTGTNGLDLPEGTYKINVTFNNLQSELIGFEFVDKSQGIVKGKQT